LLEAAGLMWVELAVVVVAVVVVEGVIVGRWETVLVSEEVL